MMKGVPGMPGNLNKLMKQAKKMQDDMQRQQAELETKTYEATAGGGVVTAVVSGRFELTRLTIKPEAVDPDDVEMLQDLVIAAVNEGVKVARQDQEETLSSLTGGLKLPGF